jgi:HPt (histidine-containing phosphotransfer) domain-containing protein
MNSETFATTCQWAPPQLLRDLDSGASGFVAEMIADFTTDTATRLQHLRRAAADADSSRVRAEVHAIRGSAREMGADAMVKLCLEIELKARDPNGSNIQDRVQELEARFGEVSSAMARYSRG